MTRHDRMYIPDPMGRVGQGRWTTRPRPNDQPPARRTHISNLDDFLALEGSVGWKGANARADVSRVETLLGLTGDLRLDQTDEPTGYFGKRLDNAIRSYQKRQGLTVDGHINPRGETITRLAVQLKSDGDGGKGGGGDPSDRGASGGARGGGQGPNKPGDGRDGKGGAKTPGGMGRSLHGPHDHFGFPAGPPGGLRFHGRG